MAAWQRYLELDPAHPTSEEDAWAGMNAALAEVRNVQNRLRTVDAPPDLFDQCAGVLRNTFSPAMANQQFAGFRDSFTAPHVSLALRWASWALRALNDPEVDAAALQTLVRALEEQETRLADPKISAPMREMLELQVRQLRAAVRLSKISGPEAIKAAVQQAYGELHSASHEAVDKAEATPESCSALKNGMELIGTAAKYADSMSKIKKFGGEVYELGTTHLPAAWHWIQSHLQSLPPPG